MSYKCQLYEEEMKKHPQTIYLKMGDVQVGRNQVWTCEKCGVTLREEILDYNKQEMDDLFGGMTNQPTFEKVIFTND